MSELKPCPFCGGEAKLSMYYSLYRVHCNSDDCIAGLTTDDAYDGNGNWYASEAEAVAAWNTRAAMEFDNWFYLPKPKEPIVEETEPTYSWDGTKVKVDVFYQVQKQAIVNWARELDENIIKRICEVWITRAERTCHEVMVDKFFRGCSECGYMWEYMYGIGKRERPNYCPCCGAKVIA